MADRNLTTTQRRTRTDEEVHDRGGRSPAQWFCLVAGATLVLVGLLGLLAEAKFDTAFGGDPGQLDGEDFIIFEVNGWHNVVHLLSGLFLLAFSGRRGRAQTAALAFGIVYAVVTAIGLIDGKDVLEIMPIDKADNVLHLLLSVAAIGSALASRDRHAGPDEGRGARFDRRDAESRDVGGAARDSRSGKRVGARRA
jgi:hypothetical protein